ncbi:MAG: transporter related protein, partial [Daejeonella sp.]|nr:transporter related protein [Daejeonella sp.]
MITNNMNDINSKSPSGDLGASIVHIQNLDLAYQRKQVFKNLNWVINRGENWLLSGVSGSGKTSLAKVIAGLQPAIGDVKINFNTESKLPVKALYVASWYQFKNLEGVANFYYQQRYTSQQAKEIITVNAELVSYGKENNLEFTEVENLLNALGFSALKTSQLIELSSGEHKKLQLVKALWLKPQLLIIDQPHTGLDAVSRQNLNILLDGTSDEGVQLILICNDASIELPSSVNRFAEIQEGRLVSLDCRKPLLDFPKNVSREL